MSSSPAPKRKRLSCACTPCRNRKVRCDERQPKCSNCLRSGDQCITVDLRHPAATAVREASCRQSTTTREDSARIIDADHHFNRRPDDTHTECNTDPNASTTAIGATSDPNEPLLRQARHEQPAPKSSATSQQTDLLPILPRFIRDGRHILTQWLDLAFLRLGLRDRFTMLRNSQADEVSSFDPQQIAPLPPLPRADLHRGLALYRATLGSVIHLPLPNEGRLPLEPCQLLVCHLVCAAVALAKPGCIAVDIPLVMANALASVGRLTLFASLESVSALVLLAVLYRGTDKPEAAWHLVAAAVAMAHSLGINKARQASANANVVSSHARDSAAVWWSLYILEKTLCLELERASGIQDSECDQVDTPHVSDETLAAIQLARVQSRISCRLLRSRQFEESGPYDLDRFGEEKTDAVHESALQLKMWEMNLPERLQPSRSFYIEDGALTAKTFLSTQFHQTQVLLHRHALILSIQSNRNVQEHESNLPRFQAGLADGYQRALRGCREIIHLLADADDRAAHSALDTAHTLMLAIYGLAIHVIKRPRLTRAGLDTEVCPLPWLCMASVFR